MVRLSLLPKDMAFAALLEQNAQNAVKIALQLRDLVNIWDNVSERVGIITDLELQGDAISHQIMARLYRTFIPPFDHKHIALLTNSIDDVTDFVHSTADAMLTYKVECPTDGIKELADILVRAVVEVERMVSEMHDRIDRDQILKRCVEINRLENIGDILYRSALGKLFADSTDIAYLIKWREIYKHIATAIDRCEDVANVLEGIAIEYT